MKTLILSLALGLSLVSHAAERPGKSVLRCSNVHVDSGTTVDVRDVDGNYVAYVTTRVNTFARTQTYPVVAYTPMTKGLQVGFRDELTEGNVFLLNAPVGKQFETVDFSLLRINRVSQRLHCQIDPDFSERD